MKRIKIITTLVCMTFAVSVANALDGEFVDEKGHTWRYSTTQYGMNVEITGFNYNVTFMDKEDASECEFDINFLKRHHIHSMPETIEINGEIYKVKGIADNAFKDNISIRNIIVSDNIEYIGEEAFAGCKNLEIIIIPKSVKTIGKNAFKNCKLKGFNIEQVHYINNVIQNLDNAFEDCDTDNVIFSLPQHLVDEYFEQYPSLFNDYSRINLKSVCISIPIYASYEQLFYMTDFYGVAETNQQSLIVKKGKFVEIFWHNGGPLLLFPYNYDGFDVWNTPPATEWPAMDGQIIPYEDLYGLHLRESQSKDVMPYYPCYDIANIDKDVYNFTVTTYKPWLNDGVAPIFESSNEDNFELYNLDGHRINANKDEMQNLPHGIYILKSSEGSKKIIL